MNIILVAGGSGGHIYPCLELGKYFEEKGHKVLMCGCSNSLEEKIYKENNFEFKGLEINKHKIKSYFKNRSKIKCIYKKYKPDAVILFGNYISVTFGIIAIESKIPIYLHEQNVIYGSANKLLGLKAKRIYLSLPIKNDFYKRKSLLVGNPKSDVIVKKVNISNNKYNVVITMGSLGSTTINELLTEFVKIADNKNINYHIVVGNKYYKEFVKKVDTRNNIKIYPYIENLSNYINSCDLFVSRAGATTISEILVFGVPAILIPSPYVKNNHQFYNAKYLFDNKACELMEEKTLSALALNEKINNLIDDENKRSKLTRNSLKLAILNSKKKIYEDIIKNNEG